MLRNVFSNWTAMAFTGAYLLHNAWYAGAYTFGRHRSRKLPDGRTRQERVPREQWHALLRDAHPGYIAWEEHERIEHQLYAGSKALGWERRQGPPREGPTLLQGRVVCGLCGSRMQIRYRPRRGGQLVPDYVCPGRGRGYAEPLCQGIFGTEIDAAVGQLLVDAVTPMALELALAVQHEIQTRLDEADRLRHRQLERAQYEADRARHRYHNVAHNTYIEITYIEITAELGFPALAAFVAVLGTTFLALGRVRQEAATQGATDLLSLAEGMQAGLICYGVSAFFVSVPWQKGLCLVVFLSISLQEFARKAVLVEPPCAVPQGLSEIATFGSTRESGGR